MLIDSRGKSKIIAKGASARSHIAEMRYYTRGIRGMRRSSRRGGCKMKRRDSLSLPRSLSLSRDCIARCECPVW